MHDNALARALSNQEFDIQLVPTYTPIRTDDLNVSVDQVFFGGINVYLQQKIRFLRWLPAVLDRFLDHPALIRRVTSHSIDMPTIELGKLALSMLQGTHGNQRKEVRRLCRWLQQSARPDAIIFTNILIGGCIPEIKRTIDVPIIVTLQGDDAFLDTLPDPWREKCVSAIRELIPLVDGFITHTQFFREYMSQYFDIPTEQIRVTPLGIDVMNFPESAERKDVDSPTLGYLARLSPEKGLHHLVDAFIRLRQDKAMSALKLRVAGWLGKQHESFAQQQFDRIDAAGLAGDIEYVGSIDRQQKIDFLKSIDILSVPTEFLEPKGLYALEAMAMGIPVVQPAHGCFPELIESSGGGLLFEPGNIGDYCDQLLRLITDQDLRKKLGANGRNHVRNQRDAHSMAQSTASVIREFL